MVGSLGLGYETLVALDEGLNRVLHLPLADVAEGLAADGRLLGGLGRRPPLRPVVSELLEEGGLDRGGLTDRKHVRPSHMRICGVGDEP